MIRVNDEEIQFDSTIMELIISLDLRPGTCAVLVNGQIVKKEEWDSYYLKNNDYVEIVSFVGGG